MTNLTEFINEIMKQFYALIHNLEKNNYDAERFSYDGIDRSQIFDIEKQKNFLFHFLTCGQNYFSVYQILDDAYSKELYKSLVLYKLLGHLHVKLPTNNFQHWENRKKASSLASVPSKFKYKSLFGELRHFDDVQFAGSRLAVDCWPANLAWSFFIKAYFFERDNIIIRPAPGDYIIDAGACFGDTALAFAVTAGNDGFVYSFDPLESHGKIITHNIDQNQETIRNIRLFSCGLGDKCMDATSAPESEHGLEAGFSIDSAPDQSAYSVRTIDSLVDSGDIKKIDFVKMDIEGYELRALKGAARAISRFKPKLAISIYHRNEDMYEIAQYVHDLGLGYKLFIDLYTIHTEELILYAVVPSSEKETTGRSDTTPVKDSDEIGFAAILIGVYDRLAHLKSCVESLLGNREAIFSDLFIAIDYPQKSQDAEKISLVIDYCKKINGFRSVKLIIREINYGPQKNYLDAMDKIFEKYPSLIVLEDDNVVTSNFLEYMNGALEFYKEDNRIFSVCGFSFPINLPQSFNDDCYLWTGFNGYGAGYWRSKYDTSYLKLNNFDEFLSDKEKVSKFFNLANHILPILFDGLRKGTVYGDAALCYNFLINKKYQLYPALSKVRNIGYDGSGGNCGSVDVFGNVKIDNTMRKTKFIKDIQPIKEIYDAFNHYFRISNEAKSRLFAVINEYVEYKKKSRAKEVFPGESALNQSVISPITLNDRVTKLSDIPTSWIIENYKSQFNVDVNKYFVNVPEISIYICNETKYKFFYPTNLEGDGQFYSQLERIPWYYMEDKWEFLKASELIHQSDKVLEIGAGKGHFVKRLIERNIDAVGLELNDSAIGYANKNALPIFKQTIKEHSKILNQKYDVVCAFQVIEHVSNVKEFIEDCISVLKEGGLFIVSVPNHSSFLQYDSKNLLDMPPHHMGQWSEEALTNIAPLFELELNHLFTEKLANYHSNYYLDIMKRTKPIDEIRNIEKMLTSSDHDIKGHTVLVEYKKIPDNKKKYPDTQLYLNLGCGSHYKEGWTNVDFRSTGTGVIAHNLNNGIPFEDSSFDVVYHSHLLEHFPKKDAFKFIQECHRVLKDGGIIRVVVPDLEQIVRWYLKLLDESLGGDQEAQKRYDWIMLELFDQMVRNLTGGEMLKYWEINPMPAESFVIERCGSEVLNVLKAIRGNGTKQGCNQSASNINAQQVGDFRLSGEIHQWMYDRYSLSKLMEQAGFDDIRVCRANESVIPDFNSYLLDINPDGSIRKPDSLFTEAKKKRKKITTEKKKAMKIVQLCMQDFGGAGNAAYRLHKGLQNIGINSTMVVLNKRSGDPSVKVLPLSYDAGNVLNCLKVDSFISPVWNSEWAKWVSEMSKYPKRPNGLEMFSSAESAVRLELVREILEADIINLHWTSGLVDIPHAPLAFRSKPVVWTLHDMNPFTGGCHYADTCKKYMSSCGACPQLGSESYNDISHKAWDQKRLAYEKLNLNIVTPSKWLGKCASQSTLFAKFPVAVIPNGFPIDIYKPYPKEEIRKALKISEKAKVILFGADDISNKRKGFKYLLDALNNFEVKGEHDIILLTFGNFPRNIEIKSKYPIINLGSLNDQNQIAAVYSAADLFVLPSLEDNLPNTAVEAMACGTPVLGFNIGGIPDMVEHKITGYLVKPKDVKGLIEGITWIISASEETRLKLSNQCRKKAEELYALNVQANNYKKVYEELFSRGQADATTIEMVNSSEGCLVSAIVSAYNSERFIRGCIEDLEAQTIADRLEIVIVDSCSPQNERAIVEEFQKKYSNIKYIRTEKRETVYAAWNRGIKAASGKYITNANTDDRHRHDAFEVMVNELERKPEIALVYADVIMTEIENETFDRHTPCGNFKWHDWDRSILLEKGCFMGPQPMWRRSVHDEYGYFDETMVTSGDYEFWLRMSQTNNFYHINTPLGLYLKSPESIEHSNREKQREENQQILSLYRAAAQKARVIKSEVVKGIPALTNPEFIEGLTSIIIPVQSIHLDECILSIKKYTDKPYEIIFLDHGAAPKLKKQIAKALKENRTYKVIKIDRKVNFAQSLNEGINQSTGEYIVLLFDDVFVGEWWLADMLECLHSGKKIGIVGAMSNDASGLQRVEGIDFNSPEKRLSFRERNRHRRINTRNLDGFCLLFRRDLLIQIDLFDEIFGADKHVFDDFCVRAVLEGYNNVIAGNVFVHNRGGINRLLSRDKTLFDEKWIGLDGATPLAEKVLIVNSMELARSQYHKGDVVEAVQTLIARIGYSPNERRLFYQIAEILLAENRFQEELDTLKGMAVADDDAEYFELLGYGNEGLGLYKVANEFADKALAIGGKFAPALNLKGILAYKKGEMGKAEEYLRRAIDVDPGFGEPYTNMGMLKWKAEQKEEAVDLFEKGFILSPDKGDLVTAYYNAISALELYSRAENIFREARAAYPENKRVLFLLIDIFLKQEKFPEAMREVEKAMVQFGMDEGIISAALAIRRKIGAKTIAVDEGKAKVAPTLSVCMIVKNEQQRLAYCLNSLSPVADEMIVVDTGSTDKTKEIAEAFGAQIHDIKWTNDFAVARNHSLSKAQGDWILVMDADEVISFQDHAKLKKLISRKDKIAYNLITRNYINKTAGDGWTGNDNTYIYEQAGRGWFPSGKVRLFPNNEKIRFENPIHELVEGSLARIDMGIQESGIPVHHYGELDAKKATEKDLQYYELGVQKMKESGGDFKSVWELAIQAGELGKFEESIELWHKVLGFKQREATAYFNLANHYLKLGKHEDSYDCSRKSYALDPKDQCAILSYAMSEFLSGDIKKAITALEGFLKGTDSQTSMVALLAVSYLISGEKDRGLKYLRGLVKKKYNCVHYLKELSQSLIAAGNFARAKSLLNTAIEIKFYDQETSALLAQCEANVGRVTSPGE